MGTTSDYLNITGVAGQNPDDPPAYTNIKFLERDGFDLIWRQEGLQKQIIKIEEDIRKIEQNANLSDTEKMFAMQMAMNTWSVVTNLRSNILKVVAESLKTIARNVA